MQTSNEIVLFLSLWNFNASKVNTAALIAAIWWKIFSNYDVIFECCREFITLYIFFTAQSMIQRLIFVIKQVILSKMLILAAKFHGFWKQPEWKLLMFHSSSVQSPAEQHEVVIRHGNGT